MRRRPRALAIVVSVAALMWTAAAFAKLISLDDRCACARPWRDHAHYVRCIKQNAYRYLRLEARVAHSRGDGPRPTRAALRAATRARVAEAVGSRCGYEQYRCDVRERPCPAGETCDVRGCDETRGVCVPTPQTCSGDGKPRCTCGSDTDPYGRTYPSECERLRAGAALDAFANAPYTTCLLSCGGADGLACPPFLACRYPDGTCGAYGEHGRCIELSASEVCPASPVCGCDGVTYVTRCAAAGVGVHVAHPGRCGSRCGGPPHLACAPGLYCFKDWGVCERDDAWGVCRGVLCLPLGAVCGCDGRLYRRPCDAILAGTQVRGLAVNGECAGL
jgi:hypothetical protein